MPMAAASGSTPPAHTVTMQVFGTYPAQSHGTAAESDDPRPRLAGGAIRTCRAEPADTAMRD